MNVTESKTFTGLTATSPQFRLRGGRYSVQMVATAFGTSAALQSLGPDGTTMQTVVTVAGGTSGAASLTAAGQFIVDLAGGDFQFTLVGSFTGFAVSISSVPM